MQFQFKVAYLSNVSLGSSCVPLVVAWEEATELEFAFLSQAKLAFGLSNSCLMMTRDLSLKIHRQRFYFRISVELWDILTRSQEKCTT